ncbi:MAG: Gfo/Idh/MocA family oxidoreductase [Acidobacteria bacterium]|nr:Gfo/Idh/MocA family oxidoreductase [Acidobacteriota bacterium]
MVAKGVLGEVTNIQTQWNCNPGWIIQPQQPRERNWRLFREFSGGLTAELVSHQVDLANWMFGDPPEFVSGVGGLDWKKDGRDIYDNVALIFKYPFGQKLVSTSLSTNKHLPLLSGGRSESGELILGTGGTIEITLGNDEQPALGLWFIEQGPKIGKAQGREEIAVIAGPTAAHRTGSPDGFPILLEQDQMTGQETFLERELKYARRWLYAKGIMVPQEECHPVRAELESFFDCCRTGRSPKADLEAGLNSSLAAILANRAMDEGRRVTFSEIES